MQRVLMISRYGLCGVENDKTDLIVVQEVATMERPANFGHLDVSVATLYTASTPKFAWTTLRL